MSKLSFRARALDASKPMPIYLAEELPDLPDYSAINRAVPQMPSGMEKEEESEHHLQRAISGTGLIIPTPEVCEVTDLEFYERCYPPDYKVPKQHIHMQPLWEEQEAPEYDIDSEDERWLRQQRHPELTELMFEQMMDKLEKCSGQTVVTLNEAKLLLERKQDLVIAVYDYWLNKRLNTQHPLILSVKTESRPGQSTNNPYLAFRRRTEKMQTRKNRKNDESSYEKMLKLRRELARALTLLQLVARREQAKRDLVRLTAALADRRYHAGDFSHPAPEPHPQPRPVYGCVTVTSGVRREPFTIHYPPRATPTPTDLPRQREKRPYKRRKHRHHAPPAALAVREGVASSGGGGGGSSSEEECGSPPDPGPFAFRRKPGCYYEMPTSTLCGDPLDSERATKQVSYEHELDERYRYTLTSISQPYWRCVGFARRRVTRGGRVALDRVRTPLLDLWTRLHAPPPRSAALDRTRHEEVELETKAHRVPKELTRDYHTSGKYPWRHAFRQHLSRNPHLWLADVKTDADDVKLDVDDVKLDVSDVKLDVSDVKMDVSDVKMDVSDVKMDCSDVKMDCSGVKVDDCVELPQNSDTSVRTNSDIGDLCEIDAMVRRNLEQVMRKRSWSGCSDTSYDSDESLYPVEKEFEAFINEVNKKWPHYRPRTPPASPPPPTPPPLTCDAPFAVQLLGANEDFLTDDITLGRLDHHLMGTEDTSIGAMSSLLEEPFLQEGPSLGSSSVTVVAPPSLVPPPSPPPAPAPPVTTAPAPAAPAATAPAPVKAAQQARTPPKVEPTPITTPPKKATPVTKERVERVVAHATHATPDGAKPAPEQQAHSDRAHTPIKIEKKKTPSSQETIEEVVVSQGVQLKTVHTVHSPLRKHIISAARRPDDAPQILTVAVSDSLKVRLQNHLLSTSVGAVTAGAVSAATVGGVGGAVGGGTVLGLVQNGPRAQPHSAVTHAGSPSTVVTVSGVGGVVPGVVGAVGGGRRVGAPRALLPHAAPVLLAPSHAIHHLHPNKLKVLHAHPPARNQVGVGRPVSGAVSTVGGVGGNVGAVSLAALGETRAAPALLKPAAHAAHHHTHPAPHLTHYFEIKAGHLAKGPHLVNVVRQGSGAGGAGAGKGAVARLDLNDAKKRQVVATFDAATLKGNLTNVRGASRVNVSVEPRVVGAVGTVGAVGCVTPVVRAAIPAVRAHQLRHQIQLKNRTFQVSRAGAVGAGAAAEASSSGQAAIASSLVANLLHKNIHLPKGQKIAMSGGGGVGGGGAGAVTAGGGGVQALAFSAQQLKARQARLVAPARQAHSEASGVVTGAGAAGEGARSEPLEGDADAPAVRRRPNDTLPMEVT